MEKFIATTASGATYRSNGHTVTIEGSSYRFGAPVTVIKPIQVKSAFQDPDESGDERIKYPWAYTDDETTPWHDVTAPVVGERFFVNGMDEWRISTPIQSVEVL